MSETGDGLDVVKSRAEKFIAAYDEMCRIGEGIGGLAVHRPDTVLTVLAEAWDEGKRAGWSDRTRSILEARTYEEEEAKATPNPYRRSL